MTPEELAEIKTRAEKATPGPWTYHYPFGGYISSENEEWLAQTWNKLEEDMSNCENNGPFIAYSRSDIPALVAAVERLWAEKGSLIARLKGQQADLARLTAENAQLRAVIEQVEYNTDHIRFKCPWCGGYDPTKLDPKLYGTIDVGHKPDCPRQAALKGGEE